MKTYQLATDDVGTTHVINRTRSLCGHQVGAAEAEVKADKQTVAKLLHAVNRGCMSCSYVLLGTPPARVRGAYAKD